ncbi:MAG: hypothetical protein SR1Q7_02750 [Quinella sp. 1Q7]|nr:hypothetical protein [Quinella sp. 1Q7]
MRRLIAASTEIFATVNRVVDRNFSRQSIAASTEIFRDSQSRRRPKFFATLHAGIISDFFLDCQCVKIFSAAPRRNFIVG